MGKHPLLSLFYEKENKMSFRCQSCKEPQTPGTRGKRIITKVRRQEYSSGTSRGYGFEIEKEMLVCEACSSKANLADLEAIQAVNGEMYIQKAAEEMRSHAFESLSEG